MSYTCQGTGDVSDRSTRWTWQRSAGDDAGRGVTWTVQYDRVLLPTYHRTGGELGSVGGRVWVSVTTRRGGAMEAADGGGAQARSGPPCKTVRWAEPVGSVLPVALHKEVHT